MEQRVLIGGTMGQLAPHAAELVAARGATPVLLGPITDEDIACGLAHMDNDVCVSAIAQVGQYLRACEGRECRGVRLAAPQLCKDCRSMCLPQLLRAACKRAGLEGLDVIELSEADVATCCQAPQEIDAPVDCPVVGVCGNVPVLTTDLFRSTVVDRLRQEGCHVVEPPLAYVVHDADFLTPAVQYFHDLGVRTCICIVAFGCLGGHVYARGQVRKLQRLYPDVELTVLDYDPSASDINLVNRTELVIQSAREAMDIRR